MTFLKKNVTIEQRSGMEFEEIVGTSPFLGNNVSNFSRYVLKSLFTILLGIEIRNMKMVFNFYGTWHRPSGKGTSTKSIGDIVIAFLRHQFGAGT